MKKNNSRQKFYPTPSKIEILGLNLLNGIKYCNGCTFLIKEKKKV